MFIMFCFIYLSGKQSCFNLQTPYIFVREEDRDKRHDKDNNVEKNRLPSSASLAMAQHAAVAATFPKASAINPFTGKFMVCYSFQYRCLQLLNCYNIRKNGSEPRIYGPKLFLSSRISIVSPWLKVLVHFVPVQVVGSNCIQF